MQYFNLLVRYSRILVRSLPLIWQAAPKEVTFLTCTMIVRGIVPGFGIWINKQIVDAVASGLNSPQLDNYGSLFSLVFAWVAAILLQSILEPFYEANFKNITEKLSAHINLLILDKANSFSDLIYFEDAHFYNEIQLIEEEVNRQPFRLILFFADGCQYLLNLITMLILLSPLGWWIPLLLLLASFPKVYFSFKIQWDIWQTMSKKSPQTRKMKYYSSVLLTDTYAKEVRLFGLGSLFKQRYIEAFADKYQAMRKIRGKQAWNLSIWEILSAGSNATAFYRVVIKAVNNQITAGNVLLFIQALNNIQTSLQVLFNEFFSLQEALIFMERLFKFLDSQPTMELTFSDKNLPTSIASGIVFENVSFAYPDGRIALERVSFTLEPGKTIALVGENGAGKTTIIKLLSRLYDPSAGKILIDGIDLKKLDLNQWRQQIAVVFQDFCRYSLTVGENIALGDLTALEKLETLKLAARKAGIADKIDRLEYQYQTLLGKQFDGTELSGGEWQKIAIARAFIREKRSQLLVLDEPTAALDPRSEYEIYNRFSELVQNKTAILVTHRLASVSMCDLIMVLKAGKLIELGTHRDLLQQQGEYAHLWQIQAQAYQI
ncbi:ABC transporter [Hyella patelloides LEGE 07179]|uniref:ABC transporter n=1 Tax=Hyella patelloides LEGE 07179 TaxID=945734 RepID=A0A563VWJ7_9CYAN|nr:ABC transporter ATP-binding protein [Hyella patelloides]VEP15829.1 ABC transporter [Hyella patelloides LEGE 07179]